MICDVNCREGRDGLPHRANRIRLYAVTTGTLPTIPTTLVTLRVGGIRCDHQNILHRSFSAYAANCIMESQMKYDRVNYDFRCRKLLDHIQYARSLSLRRLDDILAVVEPKFSRRLTRTSLYRAMVRLRELGLDSGPDDLSTARRLGRPTRGEKK